MSPGLGRRGLQRGVFSGGNTGRTGEDKVSEDMGSQIGPARHQDRPTDEFHKTEKERWPLKMVQLSSTLL